MGNPFNKVTKLNICEMGAVVSSGIPCVAKTDLNFSMVSVAVVFLTGMMSSHFE